MYRSQKEFVTDPNLLGAIANMASIKKISYLSLENNIRKEIKTIIYKVLTDDVLCVLSFPCSISGNS